MSAATESKSPNGLTTTKPTASARMPLVVHDESEVSHLMDTARFEHLFRIARTLANSSLTPKHLKGRDQDETAANCFRVVNQALRWKFDPFAVADETYVVGGKLGYQGKLVAAVVNSRAGLIGRLRPSYSGEGANRSVTIHGRFQDEAEDRTIDLSLAQAKTANDMWVKDPDQKLFYSGVIKWARRHCPEVIMGVLTEDDLERIQIDTTARPAIAVDDGASKSDQLASRLAAQQTHSAHAREVKAEADTVAANDGSEGNAESPGTLDGLGDSLAECWTDEECDAVLVDFNDSLTPDQRTALEVAVEQRKAELRKPTKK